MYDIYIIYYLLYIIYYICILYVISNFIKQLQLEMLHHSSWIDRAQFPDPLSPTLGAGEIEVGTPGQKIKAWGTNPTSHGVLSIDDGSTCG